MSKILKIAFLCWAGLSSAYAQQYPFRTFSIEQGLSESVVYDMAQDEEGYIWLATGFGLNRFDGIRFQNYFEGHGLNSSRTRSLLMDSKGKLWIGSEAGINYFRDDSIYTVAALSALNNSTVISMIEDQVGNLWIGTDGNGVWQYSTGQVLTQYTTSNGLIGNRIRAIAETESGAIWFGTRNGLTVLDQGNFINYSISNGTSVNRVRSIEVDEKGLVWIGTRNGLVRYDGQEFTSFTSKDGLINNLIRTLTVVEGEGIWIGTEEGASFYDGQTFTNYTVRNGLSTSIVQSSMMDLEGNMWLGTYGGGVSYFLGNYIQNYDTEQGLPNNLITSFTEDANGNIWIASYGGGITSLNEGRFNDFGVNAQLPDDQIYTLFKDSNERIWIGMGEGLAYMEDGNIHVYDESIFPYQKVRNIMEHSDGSYWISTYDDGIIHYQNGSFTKISSQDGLAHDRVVYSVEGDDGSVWIATYGGITRYKDGEFQSFAIQEGLPNNAVMNLLKDDKGRIWASTFGGIAWFDGLKFQSITPDEGLPDDVCYFIHQNREGFYWIGTTEGVVQFDAEQYFNADEESREQAFQTLNQEQGLIANELNLGAVYEDRKGYLWFGTVEGFSRFDPHSFEGNQVPPEVHIVEVYASGREYKPDQAFVLSHQENYVEIRYSGINFTAPNQILYEYRLSGIDPEWQVTNSRSVKYPSLPPGEYTFQVHGRNANGAWSKTHETLHFTIRPPFWMQWWFVLLVISFIVGIIYLFYNYYKARKMIDIERMRVRIASDLHDDVGASLTEIALQSDFLQAGDADTEFKRSLAQIGRQCRKIVSSLDDIVWSIDARNDTLGDLTDRMQDYILNTLESKNMEVHYNFDHLNMANKLPVSVKENVYLIFKEAVNNIAKYSDGDKVEIKLENNNGQFEFMIKDNGTTGKGVKKTGHGLRNMDMRAKRIGANVSIDTEDGFTIKVEGTLKSN